MAKINVNDGDGGGTEPVDGGEDALANSTTDNGSDTKHDAAVVTKKSKKGKRARAKSSSQASSKGSQDRKKKKEETSDVSASDESEEAEKPEDKMLVEENVGVEDEPETRSPQPSENISMSNSFNLEASVAPKLFYTSGPDSVDANAAERIKSEALSRKRKQVERYAPTEVIKRVKQDLVIPDGQGSKLQDLPFIAEQINKSDSVDLKKIHKFIFGRPGSYPEIKKNLRQFSGFSFAKPSADYEKKKQMFIRMEKPIKDEFCNCFGIASSGTDEEVAEKLMDFLLCPSVDGIEEGAPGATESKAASAGKSPKKKTPTSSPKKASTPKKKSPSTSPRKKSPGKKSKASSQKKSPVVSPKTQSPVATKATKKKFQVKKVSKSKADKDEG